MSSSAPLSQQKKSNASHRMLAVLGLVVLLAALVFSVRLLIGSSRASNKEIVKRPTIMSSYQDIPVPSELVFSEHKSVTTGTPSEVYFYTYIGSALSISNIFASRLNIAGYSVTKSTNGLIFSATKESSITMNFTFSEPNQLKVVAI